MRENRRKGVLGKLLTAMDGRVLGITLKFLQSCSSRSVFTTPLASAIVFSAAPPPKTAACEFKLAVVVSLQSHHGVSLLCSSNSSWSSSCFWPVGEW
ncbi:hypothetical protein PIB30_079335 [Stylosanthes scabra]|uniref:Uncharacterized protein n=1 Tax=Stylosanthes scabra TaxID=79078 RepID=A0ABU6XPQ9_9FABA|nr:hypothetical protein [Stylosanthes scabra]